MALKLSIDRCPTHNFYAICVGDDDGGKRLTPSKCCGRWDRVRAWSRTPAQLRDIAAYLIAAAEDAERDAEKEKVDG